MKVSFVIPAFNEEKYIGKCLDSITPLLNSKSIDCEVIVVNNASTDKTRDVVLQYPVTLVDEPQKGLARARQAGFMVAKGDLIANVDADTVLTSEWIKTVLETFDSNRDLVALSGPQIFYDVPKSVNYWAFIFYGISWFTHLANRFFWHTGSVLQGGNFVVRRSALEKIGGFNPQFTFYGEDADVARRLNKVGEVQFTFKLPIYASGRRVMKEGKFTMAGRYFVNYVWTNLFKKPFTTKSEDIRVETKVGTKF